MPTYLSPGVYVEEVRGGAADRRGRYGGGRVRRPRRAGTVQRADARDQLDPVHHDLRRLRRRAYLAQSVYGYFLNGGGNCYIVRVGQDGATPRRQPQGAGDPPAPRQATAGGYRSSGPVGRRQGRR